MIRDKLMLIPDKPGCYLMKNKDNTIIYVGKAKNLKNRVKSYFTGSHNAKTTLLVSEIVDFEYITTNSELEAFILELHLIKEHDPKYNIKLTDDKTYPYIVITNEKYPRLIVTRSANAHLGKKFGPYPNVFAARETVRLLNNIYPLRKCSHLPKKECLYYHINQCLGPCIKEINSSDYTEYINVITSFLKGNIKETIDKLEQKMLMHSDNLEFEEALEVRKLIEYIKRTVEKQKIELSDYVDRDIIGFYCDDNDICIHMFFMRSGAIVAHKTEIINNVFDYNEVILSYLGQYYEKNYLPKEILTRDIDISFLEQVIDATFLIPQKGDKSKLVDLAFENAKLDLLKGRELYRNKEENKRLALKTLTDMLGLDSASRMEIFDNSNILGTNPVSAMVCYVNGTPSKKDYRKYKVKTVSGANDYETMKEIVYRRYYRLMMEGGEMPNIIVMDGGVIQVNACLEIIQSFGLNISVIGLKKNQNHKTEAIIYDNKEYPLDLHSPLYQLLSGMQEEVHRFAISFHRDVRSKGMLVSVLDNIDGIGKTRKTNILKTFPSKDAMINASYEEYQKIGVNKTLADKIKKRLLEDKEKTN